MGDCSQIEEMLKKQIESSSTLDQFKKTVEEEKVVIAEYPRLFHLAVDKNKKELVQFFLDSGVNIEFCDKQTALAKAFNQYDLSHKNNSDIIVMLIQRHADYKCDSVRKVLKDDSKRKNLLPLFWSSINVDLHFIYLYFLCRYPDFPAKWLMGIEYTYGLNRVVNQQRAIESFRSVISEKYKTVGIFRELDCYREIFKNKKLDPVSARHQIESVLNLYQKVKNYCFHEEKQLHSASTFLFFLEQAKLQSQKIAFLEIIMQSENLQKAIRQKKCSDYLLKQAKDNPELILYFYRVLIKCHPERYEEFFKEVCDCIKNKNQFSTAKNRINSLCIAGALALKGSEITAAIAFYKEAISVGLKEKDLQSIESSIELLKEELQNSGDFFRGHKKSVGEAIQYGEESLYFLKKNACDKWLPFLMRENDLPAMNSYANSLKERWGYHGEELVYLYAKIIYLRYQVALIDPNVIAEANAFLVRKLSSRHPNTVRAVEFYRLLLDQYPNGGVDFDALLLQSNLPDPIYEGGMRRVLKLLPKDQDMWVQEKLKIKLTVMYTVMYTAFKSEEKEEKIPEANTRAIFDALDFNSFPDMTNESTLEVEKEIEQETEREVNQEPEELLLIAQNDSEIPESHQRKKPCK